MNNYSTEIVQAIQNTIEDMDLKLVAFDEERGIFGFAVNVPGPISTIRHIINIRKNDYTVIAFCPVRPGGNRSEVLPSVAEFVGRANYGLPSGHFDMDFTDGEVSFKCFVDCVDQIPSHRVVCNSICIPAVMIMRYGPGLINVMYKGMDPETAVNECEGAQGLLRGLEEVSHVLDRLQKHRRNNNNRHSPDMSDLDLDSLRPGGRSLDGLNLTDDDVADIPSYEEYRRTQDALRETNTNEDNDANEDDENDSVE